MSNRLGNRRLRPPVGLPPTGFWPCFFFISPSKLTAHRRPGDGVENLLSDWIAALTTVTQSPINAAKDLGIATQPDTRRPQTPSRSLSRKPRKR